MRAIVIEEPGDESCMQLGDAPTPELRPGALRIENHAAGVNRADLMQRRGLYPPPPGSSPLLGLECAGIVTEVGVGVSGFAVGDRVMALLPGGGYAEEVVVDAGSAIPLPETLSFHEGAGLTETLLTVHLNVWRLGGLPEGGSVLVHGGGSGIGTTTIDLVKRAGGTVIATAGSAEKCARCKELGADAVANYKEDDWVAIAKEATGGKGVDVVLDSIGAAYLENNLATLANDGALVLIGLMGGAKAEVNLGLLLTRRLKIVGSTLRTRSNEEKASIVRDFLARFGDDLADGKIRPILHEVLPLAEAPEAHRMLQASTHFGKVVLAVR
ncbi:MAG: NAD(P)H-quinone oxidoreductase [bacterium]|nr:NAD(P)H-quinone oxidoreductase [bacterium]